MVQQTMQKIEFYHISGTGLNTAPVFTPTPDQSIAPGQPTTINFTINDAEQDPSLLTITASSSDQAVIPNANIVLGGSGSNRTVTLTPLAESGTAHITLTANDGQTSSSDGFYITVEIVNRPPALSNVM